MYYTSPMLVMVVLVCDSLSSYWTLFTMLLALQCCVVLARQRDSHSITRHAMTLLISYLSFITLRCTCRLKSRVKRSAFWYVLGCYDAEHHTFSQQALGGTILWGRVQGQTMVSRSLGDHDLKKYTSLVQCVQK